MWNVRIGAGDDEENWCMGMNSDLFWANKDEILSSDDPKEVHMHLNMFMYMHVYYHVYELRIHIYKNLSKYVYIGWSYSSENIGKN